MAAIGAGDLAAGIASLRRAYAARPHPAVLYNIARAAYDLGDLPQAVTAFERYLANKKLFAGDRAAIDGEVERLKRLVDLGGYLPCIDHRIPGDAEWDNVSYYCEAMRKAFPG